MPPGTKPAPPGEAKRPNAATRQWTHADGAGWRHGDPDAKPNTKARREGIPSCGLPPGELTPNAAEAWASWMSAWWASFYELEDLPQLRWVFSLFVKAELDTVPKVLPLLDRYGITPKGRQDLRWAPPKGETEADASAVTDEIRAKRAERAARLA